MLTEIRPFPVGHVSNPIPSPACATVQRRAVRIRFGQRLSAMSLDSSKITVKESLIYSAGEIVFAVDTGNTVTASIVDQPGVIEVERGTTRPVLVRHGVGLIREALQVNDGVRIGVKFGHDLPHCGLGSSSAVIAATAIALNELYGCPLSDATLARYLAQNHGEEIRGDDSQLVPVQCLGGSGIANLVPGALTVLAGETTLIGSMTIPDGLHAVLAVPEDLPKHGMDALALIQAERDQAAGFEETGRKYAQRVAFDLVHDGLPRMAHGDLSGIGRIVFRHRFEMGSIRNCSFIHPRLLEIADGVRPIWERHLAPVLGLSSVGPAFYAITSEVAACRQIFEANRLRCFVAPLFNTRYQVVEACDIG